MPLCVLLASPLLAGSIAAAAPQQPAAPSLRTRWADEVTPENVWADYPRPTLQRGAWQNLNGLWDYAILPADAPRPTKADGQLLVPFPVESALSRVQRRLAPDQRLWCRRKFTLGKPEGQRVWLHFEAVDWESEVWLDGVRLGDHRGGYDRFSFDATDALGPGSEHVLLVAVRDPSDQGPQPRGKQVQRPGGIWYTPSSGIWQTVWLEIVAPTHIAALRVTGDPSPPALTVAADVAAAQPGDRLRVTCALGTVAPGAASVTAEAEVGRAVTLPIPSGDRSLLWAPGHPVLLPLHLEVLRGGAVLDAADSYGALRAWSVAPDADGMTRLCLNGAPRFLFGPLDQGFWPDGFHTPPSFAAMCSDLDAIEAMGCNLVRKHVKVECERYYAECDRRGLVVWQDMPSGDAQRDPAGFERELRALLRGRANHPSIAMWVVFNEGWGQHDTARYVDLVRGLDPTRLVSNASGWTDQRCGDVIDLHVYPGPGMLPAEPKRASVLGEFGGLGLPIAGHTWETKDNWGYVSLADPRALTEAYCERLAELRPWIARGLSAAVWTQTTDVEVEVNGWLTYDRAVTKIDVAQARAAAQRLYQPIGAVATVVPCALDGAQSWRWTTTAPPDGWQRPAFDAAAWRESVGGFGSVGTPGARIGTPWTSSDLWLRRTIVVPEGALADPHWQVHHDEDLEVWLDGEPVLQRRGYTQDYALVPVTAAVRARLTPGTHVLALHCHQTGGGQYVDLGLCDLRPRAAPGVDAKR